jgi:hypothetical protein
MSPFGGGVSALVIRFFEDIHPRYFFSQFFRFVDEQREALRADMDRFAVELHHEQGDMFFVKVAVQAGIHRFSISKMINLILKGALVHSAVHRQHHAGDIACRGGYKEHRRVGEFGRRAHASEGAVPGLFQDLLIQRGAVLPGA